MCCFQTGVLDHSSCAWAEEGSENCPVVTAEQRLCLQLPLINKAKAACSAVWAPSSPSCFQKQGGQPHSSLCAVWAVLSFHTLLFFGKQLFPVAHASARAAPWVPLSLSLSGMRVFLCSNRLSAAVATAAGQHGWLCQHSRCPAIVDIYLSDPFSAQSWRRP